MTAVACLCVWVLASVPVAMLTGRWMRDRYAT